MIKKWTQSLEEKIIPFDLRSLGVFRILFGLTLIYNLLVYRLPSIGLYYNNAAWLPDYSASDYYGPSFPIFKLFDLDLWYYFLMAIMMLCSIAFTIGWKTRWVTPVLFILFASLFTTNPYVIHGVESLQEITLFWCLFLPLDRTFGISTNSNKPAFNYTRFAQLGLILQLFLIYFSAWIFKDGELWKSGKVLEIVSHDLIHATPVLQYIGQYPALCQWMTYAGLGMEILISLLLLFSTVQLRIRYFAALGIVLLHAMMALLMDVGNFFPLGIAFAILLLPGGIWSYFAIGNRNILDSQVSATNSHLFIVKQILVVISILFIFHGNLHFWSKNSYISKFLVEIPFYEQTIGRHAADPGIFSSLWHQSWKFFPNNIYKDLGDFIYLGITEGGQIINLSHNTAMRIDKVDGKFKLDTMLPNQYSHTEFIFAVYLKFFTDRFPKETQRGWLELQVQDFQENYPDRHLKEAQLWKLQRTYDYNSDTLIIKDSLYQMMNYDINKNL